MQRKLYSQSPDPPTSQQQMARGTPIVFGLGLVMMVAVGIAMSSFTIVNAGTRGVVTTFGQITGVRSEGLHFKMPFITNVTTVNIRTQRYEATASAASQDLQIVSTQVVLNYRPDPQQVETLIRTIGPDFVPVVVEPALQEALKAATAQFTAEQLITQRPQVSERIKQVLEERLTPRGVVVEDLSITDFSFSDEFRRAVEQKQVAQQDALRAEEELRRAQIEAQQQVARAEAEAQARIEVATAEAEALRLQREVISPELLQLRFIERWNGIMPQFMTGDEAGLMLTVPAPSGTLPETTLPAAPNVAPAPPSAPADPGSGETPSAPASGEASTP
ncbi:MAG: hypothetical protein RLZZ387_5320 [Chloroflexota bacterium]|jgi:regulator of protease activity HflC (stomatin/prohibitin superfamily)